MLLIVQTQKICLELSGQFPQRKQNHSRDSLLKSVMKEFRKLKTWKLLKTM